MAVTLKSIRSDIAKLQAEIADVSAAMPPVEELADGLRATLNELASTRNEFLDSCADVVAHNGDFRGVLPVTDRGRIHLAIGLHLAPAEIDAIVAESLARAKEQANGGLRLSRNERIEREKELRIELYELELQEQTMLTDPLNDQRIGVNPAAYLGIPLEAAIEHDLLGGAA